MGAFLHRRVRVPGTAREGLLRSRFGADARVLLLADSYDGSRGKNGTRALD